MGFVGSVEDALALLKSAGAVEVRVTFRLDGAPSLIAPPAAPPADPTPPGRSGEDDETDDETDDDDVLYAASGSRPVPRRKVSDAD